MVETYKIYRNVSKLEKEESNARGTKGETNWKSRPIENFRQAACHLRRTFFNSIYLFSA